MSEQEPRKPTKVDVLVGAIILFSIVGYIGWHYLYAASLLLRRIFNG